MSCIPWIVIPRTARTLHAVWLNIYCEGPKSQCKKQCVTAADRLISVHKAALCFRIRLFFHLPSPSQLLCTCFKPALSVRIAIFHVLGLVGFSSAASLLMISTGRCAHLIFLQPP